jgi:chorismate mutase
VRAGAVKRRLGRQVLDRRRERRVLARVAQADRGPLPAEAVRGIFQIILRHCRRLEGRWER